MFSILISLITFIGICAGTAAGMAFRKRLPQGDLTGDSRDAIKLGAGLIATMTALLLSRLQSHRPSGIRAQRFVCRRRDFLDARELRTFPRHG
jgi:hypothetical protein